MKILLLAAVFALNAIPSNITCPFDGANVGWNGHYRVREGQTECNFRHVWIHSRGSLIVDEVHNLWMPCEIIQK